MNTYPVSLTYLRGTAYFQNYNVVNDYTQEPRPFYSVAYIIRGNARFFWNHQEICVGERDVIFIPKGCRYHSVWFQGLPYESTFFFS